MAGKSDKKQVGGGSATGSPSKRGLIIGVVALAAVIVIAAIAYNALAPAAGTGMNLQAAGSAGAATSESAAASKSADSETLPGGESSRDESASAGSAATGDAAASAGSASRDDAVLAPDIMVTAADGRTVQLSSLRGRPLVLNFWASTCPPCRSEMPAFQEAFERQGADGIQFAMVDVIGFNGETEQRAREFLAQQGFTFPVYFDTEGQGTYEYGLSSVPRTFFIDAEGYVVATASGAIDAATLARGLGML